MSAAADRPNAAVLVVDVQRDVVANAHDAGRIIANIGTVIDKARAADVPVVWIQHYDEDLVPDTHGWEYVEELQRLDDEPLVHKAYCDSFEGTDLEEVLSSNGIGRLYVTGSQTDYCVRATLHGGLTRGYDTTLVSDAHTTDDIEADGLPVRAADVIAHTNHYWRSASAVDSRGGIVSTADLDFGR